MTIEITVPKLSATMEEATLLRWHRAEGDTVREGEVLVELETDKAALEVEATASGVLLAHRAREGEVVAVGAVIAVLGEPGSVAEENPLPPSEAGGATPTPPPSGADGVTPMPPLGRPAPSPVRRTLATPLARRLAAEGGLALGEIAGTGPRGRITRRDIEAARLKPREPAPEPARAPVPVPAAASDAPSRMRRAIAAQVAESRRTIPAFTLDRWVDLGLLEDSRDLLNRRLPQEARLSVTDMVVQAMADVLPAHPRLLSVWHEGDPPRMEARNGVAIGLVVALDDGLMIPVLDGIEGLGLEAIARLRRDAVAAARAGRLGAAFSGKASISISNIGRVGVDRFEAIISPGETAILAIGRLHERAVAQNGALRAARGAHFTLSVDHRLVDGVVGGAFLGALAERIERQTWRL